MNGKFLLDTNIVISLFSGDASISEKIAVASEIYLPAIVIGELYYGAYNSTKRQANIERIEAFKLEIPILDCDEYTANYYGQIKSELKPWGTCCSICSACSGAEKGFKTCHPKFAGYIHHFRPG